MRLCAPPLAKFIIGHALFLSNEDEQVTSYKIKTTTQQADRQAEVWVSPSLQRATFYSPRYY